PRQSARGGEDVQADPPPSGIRRAGRGNDGGVHRPPQTFRAGGRLGPAAGESQSFGAGMSSPGSGPPTLARSVGARAHAELAASNARPGNESLSATPPNRSSPAPTGARPPAQASVSAPLRSAVFLPSQFVPSRPSAPCPTCPQ